MTLVRMMNTDKEAVGLRKKLSELKYCMVLLRHRLIRRLVAASFHMSALIWLASIRFNPFLWRISLLVMANSTLFPLQMKLRLDFQLLCSAIMCMSTLALLLFNCLHLLTNPWVVPQSKFPVEKPATALRLRRSLLMDPKHLLAVYWLALTFLKFHSALVPRLSEWRYIQLHRKRFIW